MSTFENCLGCQCSWLIGKLKRRALGKLRCWPFWRTRATPLIRAKLASATQPCRCLPCQAVDQRKQACQPARLVCAHFVHAASVTAECLCPPAAAATGKRNLRPETCCQLLQSLTWERCASARMRFACDALQQLALHNGVLQTVQGSLPGLTSLDLQGTVHPWSAALLCVQEQTCAASLSPGARIHHEGPHAGCSKLSGAALKGWLPGMPELQALNVSQMAIITPELLTEVCVHAVACGQLNLLSAWHACVASALLRLTVLMVSRSRQGTCGRWHHA